MALITIKQLLCNTPKAHLLAIPGGVISSILGLSVLFGWHTQNVALIQISAAFVPMQYNTALGFLLSGLGLLLIIRGHHRTGMACGIFVMLLGLLTLVEYILGIDLGIDQLLMQHYITVETSHPGRMAPNTALCFSLTGAALAVLETRVNLWKPVMIAGVLGSLILGLGFVSLTGYAVSFEAAYGWGELTRMAVHTAGGFMILGVAVSSLAWHREVSGLSCWPFWFPLPVGLGVVTITISLWQALDTHDAQLMKQYDISGDYFFVNNVLLLVGIALAVALSMATYLAQAARKREREVVELNSRLKAKIDERNMVENNLRASEERWQFALEGNRDGVWDWNVVSNEVFFSTRWKEMLGYEEGEIDNSLDEWEKRIHPDDKEHVSAAVNKHFDQITPFYESEHRVLCKDGSYKWILDRGKIVSWTEDKKPQRMIGTHTDVTERKQLEQELQDSELQLRSITSAANDAIIMADDDGNIVFWNNAAEHIFGFSRAEAIGRSINELIIPGHLQEKHKKGYAAFCQSGGGEVIGKTMEISALRKDGSKFPVELSISNLKLKGRWHAIGILRDITEKKKQESILHQAQKMEAVGQLTGGIAHDFNNLLSIISGNLRFLKEDIGETNEAIDELFEDAISAANDGAELTERLLGFSRTRLLHPEVKNVNETIEKSVRFLARTLADNTELETVLPDETLFINVDPSQLENALLNLCLNARDAMPEGGMITISAESCQNCDVERLVLLEGDYVKISVSDTGSGISPEDMQHVYEPFFTTKDIGKGSGLGLSMVFGFTQQSQGACHIDSTLGKGTTVSMYFPEVIERRKMEQGPKDEERRSSHGSKVILVVEDEPRVRRGVLRDLRKLGYQTLEAENADMARIIIESGEHIDLLFSDMLMPGEMDGHMLAVWTQEHYPQIKIVLTSGFSKGKTEVKEDKEHPFPFLRKPYSIEKLAKQIKTTFLSRQ